MKYTRAIARVRLDHVDRKIITEILEVFDIRRWDQASPVEQRDLASSVSFYLQNSTGLHEAVRAYRKNGVEAVVVCGMPQTTSKLFTAALAQMFGESYNYNCQNGGDLVMDIVDDDLSRANSNFSTDNAVPHTHDSALPQYARTESILLRGIENQTQAMTSYSSLRCALQSRLVIDMPSLLEPAYRKRLPISFGLETDLWTPPEPIIADIGGRLELAFPSHATEAASPRHDHALRQLKLALKEVAIGINLNPDTFIVFSNRYGAQSQKKHTGFRRLHRVCVTSNTHEIQQVTGRSGPIFQVDGLLKRLSTILPIKASQSIAATG